MTTSIAFTDGGGAVSITNGLTVPADRFRQWVPDSPSVKAESESLATGQPFPFVFSQRYTVTFRLDEIPQTQQANVMRLILWLEGGGVITVNTDDAAARSYTQCYMTKGQRPQFTLTDPPLLRYSLVLSLVNIAGAPFLCQY